MCIRDSIQGINADLGTFHIQDAFPGLRFLACIGNAPGLPLPVEHLLSIGRKLVAIHLSHLFILTLFQVVGMHAGFSCTSFEVEKLVLLMRSQPRVIACIHGNGHDPQLQSLQVDFQGFLFLLLPFFLIAFLLDCLLYILFIRFLPVLFRLIVLLFGPFFVTFFGKGRQGFFLKGHQVNAAGHLHVIV